MQTFPPLGGSDILPEQLMGAILPPEPLERVVLPPEPLRGQPFPHSHWWAMQTLPSAQNSDRVASALPYIYNVVVNLTTTSGSLGGSI